MLNVKISGIDISLHFSFFLFNAVLFMYQDERIIIGFYAACLLHELGHILAAEITGQRIISVELRGTGILMIPEKNAAAPLSSGLFVLLSGAAVNFLIYFLCGGRGFFAEQNLFLGIYNLLPYRSLDGGAAISLVSCGSIHERTTNLILTVVKAVLSAAILAAAVHFCGTELPKIADTISL